MKYLHLLILPLFLTSCQSDSFWVDDSNLHIKTENQTFTFTDEAKDSLLSIILQFKNDQINKDIYFTDLLEKSDIRYFPHPDLVEKFGNDYSEENYRFILLTSSNGFPDKYIITDKHYNDNLYDAIAFATDRTGSSFFEMYYITFDTLDVTYSEDFFPDQIFARDLGVPQGFEYVKQEEKERAESKNRRYQKHFYRLNEKSLFKNCHDDMIQYRLSKFPSFDPYFTISVTDEEGKIMLHGKKMIEAPYDNRLAVDYLTYEIELSSDQWFRITSKIEALSFWDKSPTRIEYSHSKDSTLQSSEIIGTDGARWLFEGCRLGEYYGIDRWSGTTEENYRVLFNYLTQLAEYDQ